MTLDIAPGASITIDGLRFTVEEHDALHEIDFRLEMVKLIGPTPAHERWLIAMQSEPNPMLMQRIEMHWLTTPTTTIIQEGEIFTNLNRGSAYRVRRLRGGRSKDGRVDYAIFRADSGRVILILGQQENVEVWIGSTVAKESIPLPG